MPRIIGADVHLRRLKALKSPQAKAAIYRGLFAAGSMIETGARHSITEGSISGKGHIPSLPGEPPNADTHQLDTSIRTEGQPGKLAVQVIADAPHAVPLEVGTSKMAERPFMAPAAQKDGPKAAEFIAKFLSQVFRKG